MSNTSPSGWGQNQQPQLPHSWEQFPDHFSRRDEDDIAWTSSPFSPHYDDDDRSSAAGSSGASSVSIGEDSDASRLASGSPRPADRPVYCQKCCHAECTTPSHHKKRSNECRLRHEQQVVFRDAEDLMEILIGLPEMKRRQQNANNAKTSGLKMTKQTIILATAGFSFRHLQAGHDQALRDGRLEQWRRDRQSDLRAILAHGDPLADTALYDPTDATGPCEASSTDRSNVCATHASGLPVTQCRKSRRAKCFERRMNEGVAARERARY